MSQVIIFSFANYVFCKAKQLIIVHLQTYPEMPPVSSVHKRRHEQISVALRLCSNQSRDYCSHIFQQNCTQTDYRFLLGKFPNKRWFLATPYRTSANVVLFRFGFFNAKTTTSQIGGASQIAQRWPTTVTAKRKTTRQKEKPHGKKNNLMAKRITSRQKEKPHGKKKNLTAKRKRLTAKRKTSRQKE